MFKRAERKKARLRLAFLAPSGYGKTYSAILVAMGIGGKIAMIDSERGSGELYADLTEYDACQINPPYTPQKYIDAIHFAENAGYNVIIIDSLSHAWAGTGGLLEEVDKKKGHGNDFAAWRTITPQHNALVDAMLMSPCHIIGTMRTKQEHVLVDEIRNGKTTKVPKKIGLQPVQRDGLEYEFTVVFDIDYDKETGRHIASASKDRTSLFNGKFFEPTVETGRELLEWLETGIEPPKPIDIPDLKLSVSQCLTVHDLAEYYASRKDEITTAPNVKEANAVFNQRKVELSRQLATQPQADEPPADEPIDPATAAFIAQDAARGEQSHATG